jgi:hypothetical protein
VASPGINTSFWLSSAIFSAMSSDVTQSISIMLDKLSTINNSISTARHAVLISQLDDKQFTISSATNDFSSSHFSLPATGRASLAKIGSKCGPLSIAFCIKTIIYLASFDLQEGMPFSNHDSHVLIDLEGQSAAHVDFDLEDSAVAISSGKIVYIIELNDNSTTILSGHHNNVTMARFLLHEPDNVISISEDRTFKSTAYIFSNPS